MIQRIAALNKFIVDVYGSAHILADGVIPIDHVRGCPQYRIEMQGVSIPLDVPVGICGTDLVRVGEGFRVLEDNLRVPSGVSYMIANRQATKTNFRELYRKYRVRDVEKYGTLLYETLREFDPNGSTDPCIVLLTPGVFNAAFYEHMFLADEIGAELVEGRDLLVNDGFV
ncbi:MAG: circularly permuted type 2 ATP-grasp protein, partial [Gammaproteobacteria bacterium]|nr:circularly permuted type 2 ATP-grasp protein [Gammaproteobacteria bacterium]